MVEEIVAFAVVACIVDAIGDEKTVMVTAFVIVTFDAAAVVVAIGLVIVIVVCRLEGHQSTLDSQPTIEQMVAFAGREVDLVVVFVVVCLIVVVALL